MLSYTDVTSTLVSEIVSKDEAHASLYREHIKTKPPVREAMYTLGLTSLNAVKRNFSLLSPGGQTLAK